MRLSGSKAVEAYITFSAKEKGLGSQFTGRWEEQVFGKQMFAMLCRQVLLILKFTFGNSSVPGTGPLSKFFQAVKREVDSSS